METKPLVTYYTPLLIKQVTRLNSQSKYRCNVTQFWKLKLINNSFISVTLSAIKSFVIYGNNVDDSNHTRDPHSYKATKAVAKKASCWAGILSRIAKTPTVSDALSCKVENAVLLFCHLIWLFNTRTIFLQAVYSYFCEFLIEVVPTRPQPSHRRSRRTLQPLLSSFQRSGCDFQLKPTERLEN